MKKAVRMTRYLYLLFFVGGLTQATAQDFRKQYRQAKDLYEEKQYSAAMAAFKPLTVYDQANPFPEYASYYYALSAQQLGYGSVAKDMFLQIKKLYPSWDQMQEVDYWLCKLYFDQGDIFQALSIASRIKAPALRAGLTELKRYYLDKVNDSETLKMVLEDYPEEQEAGRALLKVLGQQPYHLQEKAMMELLINKFNLPREKLVTVETPKPVFKDSYRVALIMPFLAATLDPSPVVKRNQFVLDIYDGVKLAADTLRKQGINLEILAYDNERSADLTRKILLQEELKSVDVMLGPLFPEESKPVLEFAQANHINVLVNPASSTIEFAPHPYSFLFQPGHETLGIRSAEWVAKNVRRKNCLVYYGESVKDSVMAFAFIKKALELGVNVVYAEEVRRETSAGILSTLVSATEHDEWKNPLQFKLKKDSLGSIFVASDNELIYSKVVNGVETRGDSIVVMGQESWLTDTSIDYSKFERTRVNLAAPNYRPVNTAAYADFRKKFIQKHGLLPGEYATLGYEVTMALGQLFRKYGARFLELLPPGELQPGYLGMGYSMLPAHDNGLIPFIRFQNGAITVSIPE
ncbi:MAG: amino acid ABC transporter substrate-binding protein [Cyclobacteriaceae bacterium]|nr:amino acid ABC transporter substrate-binding protein [Cyclobacteriaceae bacterium]